MVDALSKKNTEKDSKELCSLLYSIAEIYDAVKVMVKSCNIPLVYLQRHHVTGADAKFEENDLQHPQSIKLKDVNEWEKGQTIDLPTVQRGFVWKSHQVENLWDSMLRGYPIGSFVMTRKSEGITQDQDNVVFELLDGQQRATAICHGFFNINSIDKCDSSVLKSSNAKLRIFIDLEKPNEMKDNRKYLFRVITKTHPWGFRKHENHKTLESNKIEKALGCYPLNSIDDYFNESLDQFWPYDSTKPIPFGIFLDAAIRDLSLSDVERSVLDWENRLGQKYNDWTSANTKKLLERIEEQEKSEVEDDEIIETQDDRNLSDVENLFIRMNAGGTRLSGEELNYSILKAHIKKDFQLRIEKECKGVMRPSRYISIAFRLFQNDPDINGANLEGPVRERISLRIKAKQFQNQMRVKKDKFIDYLTTLEKEHIIDDLKKLTLYSSDNLEGLPNFILTDMCESAPEIIFLLMYRYKIKKDRFDNEVLKRKMIGMLTLLFWLGKGEKQKNHARLLQNVWPCVSKIDNAIRFWSNETIGRAMIKYYGRDVLTSVPTYREIKKIITANLGSGKDAFSKSSYRDFIQKMFFNYNLVLYSQREFIANQYKQLLSQSNIEMLDDINRPFDWDHICPYAKIDGRKNIHRAIKDWYAAIGNIRAWPYGWNRSDQDNDPKVKLNKHDSTKEELEKWEKRLLKNGGKVNNKMKPSEISNTICTWSACDLKDWGEIEVSTSDLRNLNKKSKMLNEAIMMRSLELCKKWYESLLIDELITSESEKIKFGEIFDMRKWDKIPSNEKDKEYWGESEEGLKLIIDSTSDIAFIISYINTKNEYESVNLEDENMYFGLRVKTTTEKRNWPKINGEYTYDEKLGGYDYLSKTIGPTLMSYHKESHISFLKEFRNWLKELPKYDGLDKKKILKAFDDSLKITLND